VQLYEKVFVLACEPKEVSRPYRLRTVDTPQPRAQFRHTDVTVVNRTVHRWYTVKPQTHPLFHS